MNFLKTNDPAPSRLSYKINRLFYRFWFRLMLVTVFFVLSVLLANKFLYKNIDLNAEFSLLSEESTAFYKGLTGFSVSKIVVKGAQESLEKKITVMIKNAANEGFSVLKAQALREKIQTIKKVEKAFVKLSTNGLVIVDVVERKEAVVFFNNDIYEVLDSNGVILSINRDYEALSIFPLLVGKDGKKNIHQLLWLVNDLGSYRSEVLFYEWVGERRWNIHMKNDLVIRLPEDNLSKGLKVMRMFLNPTNELLKRVISVDLRNVDKPIIKFRKTKPVEVTYEKKERLAG